MTNKKNQLMKRDKNIFIELIEQIRKGDSESVLSFLKEPATKITAFLAGIFKFGRVDIIDTGSRLLQYAIFGEYSKGFGKEYETLVAKNLINKDFGKTKYGPKTLIEFLEFIDKETPDEDKFNAMKALFNSVVATDVNEKEQILNYQLFQIAKGLTSSQLLVLKTCYAVCQMNKIPENLAYYNDWLTMVADNIGHGLNSLIERDDDILLENKLLTPRIQQANFVRITKDNARLSGLGIKLCENLKKYDFNEMISKTKIP